jgi:YbbR domain-containing protein
MIEKIKNNWLWKVAALLIAFVLWLVVVNYDDPYIKKTFNNVVVEKRNELAITAQDQAIEYKEGESISVTLGGKRSIIDRLTFSDIKAYADLGKVSITNTVDIVIEVNDQLDILEKKPSNMQISLEPIIKTLKDIQVTYVGELENNYIRLNPVIIPNQIEITGPQSQLARVAEVRVPIRIDKAYDDVTVYVTPQIVDAAGREILGLHVSNNQIQVKVPIQKIKTVPVVFQTVGALNDAYRLVTMELDMKEIIVRGESDVLNNFTELVVPNIDLSAFNQETESYSINLNQYLPAGINVYNSDALTELIIEVVPLVNQEYSIELDTLAVRQLGVGLTYTYLDTAPLNIRLRGIEKELSVLETESLQPRVFLRDLGPGVHTVEVEFDVPDRFEWMSGTPTVRIEISANDQVEDTTDN